MNPTVNNNLSCHRKRDKVLGVPELIAIALGGMIGGGIFTILGVSVSLIGVFTPAEQMYSIIGLYLLLTAGSWLNSRRKH